MNSNIRNELCVFNSGTPEGVFSASIINKYYSENKHFIENNDFKTKVHYLDIYAENGNHEEVKEKARIVLNQVSGFYDTIILVGVSYDSNMMKYLGGGNAEYLTKLLWIDNDEQAINNLGNLAIHGMRKNESLEKIVWECFFKGEEYLPLNVLQYWNNNRITEKDFDAFVKELQYEMYYSVEDKILKPLYVNFASIDFIKSLPELLKELVNIETIKAIFEYNWEFKLENKKLLYEFLEKSIQNMKYDNKKIKRNN